MRLERPGRDINPEGHGASPTPFQPGGPSTIVDSQVLKARSSAALRLFAVAGLCFAGDLAFWHWSIKLTSVANSTLLTNFAPFFVTLGARFLFLERITLFLLGGMFLAFLGGAMLVGASIKLTTAHIVLRKHLFLLRQGPLSFIKRARSMKLNKL